MKKMACCMAAVLTMVTAAPAADFTFDTPSDDRWHYPFNFSPGFRTTASCFGTVGTPGFNNRDAMIYVAWDTSELIAPGKGAGAYDIQSITVTLTNQANAFINPDWPIDTTADEWFTYDLNADGMNNADGIPRGEAGDTDGESDDIDPGRPLELFGLVFGPTTSESTWGEFTPFIGGDSMTVVERDPFPFVFQDGTNAPLHVEDNVSGLFNDGLGVFQFTPTPWATGSPIGYTPGAQSVPFDVQFDIDLTLADGEVKAYFQEQLNNGRIIVAVTSLRETVMMGSSSGVPSFYMKEGVSLDPGAKAASLRVTIAEPDVPAISGMSMAAMASIFVGVGALVSRRQRLLAA